MLNSDEIERILDVAEEFGISVDEESVQEAWNRYSESKGVEKAELPINNIDIADILKGELCVGV